jgi:hypothetical protein
LARSEKLKEIKNRGISLKEALDKIHEIVHKAKVAERGSQRLTLRRSKARSTKS